MASKSTTPTSEVSLTPEQKKYLSNGDPLMRKEEKILEKGTLIPEEKTFLEKKMLMEKKLMSGEYGSLEEMAIDINQGNSSKGIEQIIFKNMMKIMLKEFNC